MRGTHGECGARAYNESLGAEPQAAPSGIQGLGPWSGGKAPTEAKMFSALECPQEAAFWPFLGFPVTAKPKLDLYGGAGPKTECCGPPSNISVGGFSPTSPPCLRPW